MTTNQQEPWYRYIGPDASLRPYRYGVVQDDPSDVIAWSDPNDMYEYGVTWRGTQGDFKELFQLEE